MVRHTFNESKANAPLCESRRNVRPFLVVKHSLWEKVLAKETPAGRGQNLNLDPPSRNW